MRVQEEPRNWSLDGSIIKKLNNRSYIDEHGGRVCGRNSHHLAPTLAYKIMSVCRVGTT